MAETIAQKNARLIRKTRERGKAFLRKHPEAFGGGIDPETGIRSVGGKRVSVISEAEKRAGVTSPTMQEARTISQIAAKKSIILQKQKTKQLSKKQLLKRKRISRIEGIRSRQLKSKISQRQQSQLSFQSNGKLIFKDPLSFGKTINVKTGAKTFTAAIPISRQNGKLLVQDFNFKFDNKGNMISSVATGRAILSESQFLEKDKFRSERLLRESKNLGKSKIEPIKKTEKRLASITGGIIAKEIQAIPQPKGFIAKKIKKFEDLQKIAATKSIRTKQKKIRNELELLGLTVGTSVISGVGGIIALPKTLVNLAKNPAQLKKIPGAIKEGAVDFGQLIRISPTEAFGKIAGEIVFLKGSGETFKVVGEVGGRAATKLSPKFRGVKSGKLEIRTAKPKILDFTKKPRKIPKPGLTIRVGGPVSEIAEPLTRQARRAGTKVTAVSAQADKLVNFIRTKRIVRKPIPDEANLPAKTKKLLKRFDDGRITRQQLIRLQNEVNILERSFFADPKGRFRPSRLGLKQEDASLIDILSGDVTFRASKPQILVFENVKIAKFPKNLKDVEKALKTGKTLTGSQSRRLLNFQTKKTGQFKPIGALSKEPEITLAPGEIIKRVKKVGVTLIDGRKVEIIQAKVVKSTASTKKLIQKANKGKITSKELKNLRSKIKKESGFDPLMGRRKGPRPRLRLPKRVPRVPKRQTRPTRKSRVPKRPTRKSRVPKRPTRKPRVPKRPTRKPRVPKRPTRKPRVPKRPARGPPRIARVPKKPPITARITTRRRRKKSVKKKTQAYNVFARPLKKTKKAKKPKLIRINKVPLRKNRAKDLRNYVADTSLARTARIKPTRGKPKKAKLKVPVGYARRTKVKFRTHRIIKGKRKPLTKGKVIERKTRLLDTRGERRKISLRKRIKQITPKKKVARKKPVKRKPVRRTARKVTRRKPVRRTARKVTRRKPVRRQARKPTRKAPARKPIKRRSPKRRR